MERPYIEENRESNYDSVLLFIILLTAGTAVQILTVPFLQ